MSYAWPLTFFLLGAVFDVVHDSLGQSQQCCYRVWASASDVAVELFNHLHLGTIKSGRNGKEMI